MCTDFIGLTMCFPPQQKEYFIVVWTRLSRPRSVSRIPDYFRVQTPTIYLVKVFVCHFLFPKIVLKVSMQNGNHLKLYQGEWGHCGYAGVDFYRERVWLLFCFTKQVCFFLSFQCWSSSKMKTRQCMLL